MELGRLIEEEALSKKIQEIGFSTIIEEIERVSAMYSWCSRRRDEEICSAFEKNLSEAVRSLVKLRIFKSLMGQDPGRSFDGEILRAISRIIDALSRVLQGYPIDPYGRIPIRSRVDLVGKDMRLRSGYVYLVHIDRAIMLVACGLADLIPI
jgi:hypothetical protein